LKQTKNAKATGTHLRWGLYALTGLVFGVLDWFYLIWLTFDFRQALTLNPTLEKGLLTLLNFGIWLVPIVPIVIIESRKALNVKTPAYAGMLTWSAAILSYYAYYASLLSLGKLTLTEHLNVFGPKFDGFWYEYWLKLRYLVLEQVLEWLPIALIGGAALGILAWERGGRRAYQFEDGRLQKIVNFYSEKVPVKVVLLIDASGSTRYSQADIRNAALEFVKRLNPDDQVAVVTFNAQAKLILDFTNKFDDVKLALDSIYARGNTVLNDALYVTFDDLLANKEGKTAVILLTDGIDTGSMTSFDEAVNLALRSDTMVYIVSKVDEYRATAIQLRQEMQSRLQPIPKELQDDYIRERKVELRRLANLSGGRLLDTSDFYSLTDIYQQVADELRNQYYLSYVPTNQDRDGGWRSVDVKVSRGGVVVSTRKGYFAPGSLPTAR